MLPCFVVLVAVAVAAVGTFGVSLVGKKGIETFYTQRVLIEAD